MVDMIDVVESCSGDWWARRFADFKKLLHRLKLEDGRRWSILVNPMVPHRDSNMLKQCWLKTWSLLGREAGPSVGPWGGFEPIFFLGILSEVETNDVGVSHVSMRGDSFRRVWCRVRSG
jgi:hypothetical protein